MNPGSNQGRVGKTLIVAGSNAALNLPVLTHKRKLGSYASPSDVAKVDVRNIV
jgi:hypothetical protein